MELNLKTIVGIVILIVVCSYFIIVLPDILFPKQEPTPQCEFFNECELSLCDCQCYKTGQTPETLQGIACSKDCQVLKNINGCLCSGGNCEGIE